jgi:hypothetical protein
MGAIGTVARVCADVSSSAVIVSACVCRQDFPHPPKNKKKKDTENDEGNEAYWYHHHYHAY